MNHWIITNSERAPPPPPPPPPTSISRIRAMSRCSSTTAEVCKCGLYLALWLALCATDEAQAGIFSERNVYITSFKYQMCRSNAPRRFKFWFRDLDILATAYGDVDFTGTFVTTVNLTSPLKATVNLKRSFLGLNVKIPCIKRFGSCTYDDLCEFGYSETDECPPILEEYDLPCRCPVPSGVYNVPGLQLKEFARTRWAALLAGKYKATMKLYQGPMLLTCYNVAFTLA